MRIVICSPSTEGFLFPSIGLALELQAEGHAAAVVTSSQYRWLFDRYGVQLIANRTWDECFEIRRWGEPSSVLRQATACRAAITRFRPDVVVGHHTTIGPLLAAEANGLPAVVLGMATYLWPTGPSTTAVGRERAAWCRYQSALEVYNDVAGVLGLARRPLTLEASPFLGEAYLLRSVEELEGGTLPPKVAYVGSCMWEPPQVDAHLDAFVSSPRRSGRRVAYVQLGRSFAEKPAWVATVNAAVESGYSVVASTARTDGAESAQIEAACYTAPHVPLLQALQHADVVITSGHTTTTLGALSAAVPTVLVPYGSGTEEVAETCLRAECATVVALSDASMPRLQEAISTAGTLSGMERVRRSFATHRGFSTAVARIREIGSA